MSRPLGLAGLCRLWPSDDDDNVEEEDGDDDGDGAIVLRKRGLVECTEVQTCSLETAWWALRLPPLVMGPTCTSQIPPRSIQRYQQALQVLLLREGLRNIEQN